MKLNFQFGSLSEWWFMAGHGPYVWSCYALTFAVLIWLAVAPRLRRRTFFAQMARQQRVAERENLQREN